MGEGSRKMKRKRKRKKRRKRRKKKKRERKRMMRRADWRRNLHNRLSGSKRSKSSPRT